MRDEGIASGLVLAATFARDGAGSAALDGALAAQLRERLAALAALDREARARALAALAGAAQPAVRADWDGPPRARALLAAAAPREVAARWQAAASAPRRGFRADDGLRATLRALAARPPADEAVARAELGHGRAWLAAARDVVGGTAARDMVGGTAARDMVGGTALDAFLDGAGAEESAAVRALGGARGGGAAAGSVGLAAAILRAAARLHGAARVRAAGAMALGAGGEAGGDATSTRWRRAGAELARVVALREHAMSDALTEPAA